MKGLKNIFIVLIMLVISVNAKNNYQIEWQPENPFRFFKEKNIYWEMRDLYKDIKVNKNKYENSKGLAFERALQSKKWKNNNYITDGWASYFAINEYKKTYWNQNSMMYEKGYINPKSYNIKVKLTGSSKNDRCNWLVNSEVNKANVLCSDETTISIPNNKKINNIQYQILGDNKFGEKKIFIEDILIVGLGDSYGSGEGNPDIPISMEENRIDRDVILVKNRYFPRKDKNSSAKWLDRRCHRSLYSYQFKTALQYSIEHPQKFVTFVSFSCTGAKTKNILTEYKKVAEKLKHNHIKPRYDGDFTIAELLEGKEDNRIDRRSYVRPQIELLKETLNGAKADILLLSIGGNDIGFAKYVGNILLKTGLKKPNHKTKYKLTSILSENYYRLDKALSKFVKDNNSSRIILTAYPKVLQDENGVLCKGDREAFDIPFGVSEKREKRLRETQKYLTKPLYKIQKRLANEIGWRFVDLHREKFKKHGFCAKNPSVPESFVSPHKVKKSEDWIPYKPTDDRYRAYREKQRWVQLPIDSMLMINKTEKFLWFDTDFFFSDEKSGILHPTADGLAVEADENVKVIESIFKLKENHYE